MLCVVRSTAREVDLPKAMEQQHKRKWHLWNERDEGVRKRYQLLGFGEKN